MDSKVLSHVNVSNTWWRTSELHFGLKSSNAIVHTCRSFQGAIIDANSNTVKVSHFQVLNFPLPSSVARPIPKNWATIPARLSYYRSFATWTLIRFLLLRWQLLNSLARKEHVAFYHGDIIDDAGTSGFPIFTANLSYTSNLERLRSSAGQLTVKKVQVCWNICTQY